MILEICFMKYLLLLDTQPWKNLLDDYAMGLSHTNVDTYSTLLSL